MRSKNLIITVLFSSLLFVGWKAIDQEWLSEKRKGYTLKYTSSDKKNKKEYRQLIENGMSSAAFFFGDGFKKEFDVFIHPNRLSLDIAWQKDWNMPDFKSECWMVASGVATKLDVISPKQWDKEACEHIYSDTNKTQQLITHELIHVYHGQLNVSPDFSDVQGIDWFVEGLATYASGQCDSKRISEVQKAILENKIPEKLDDFWKGKIKYGLSGSVVMFIDKTYGREKLRTLLPLNKKSELLAALNTTESELLAAWRNHILEYKSGQ
ncbi:hypothetical protein FEDK69T_05830 [Flavobacterium enshiense DK69]|uniref:Peptidase MA-like domain-containing protein n=1 Tax=Flavobacterium enshiense DK69 TaxID=1107311 RepID=V6SCI5_9FLAO|nr:hypothetical protein [Flavobacterium enshiense]ESU24149.1 hypothetical protein FEDK69T_05830 [Flavobacterium enshiense DK69]KGO95473.1 hypothetical protein Q767_11780 [Flavobacterium enshiense DK69]